MSLGVVGTATGTTGGDVGGDTHDTAAASPVQQTPFVSGTNSLGDANTTFAGVGANDTFGSALAHGDLNGDGVEDVVVGAPENDSTAGNNSGAVYVFYGPIEEGDIDAESANVTLHGVDAGDRAGYAVSAGDVDDDGTDDLVVGAPLEDANGQSAGTAYVVYGGDDLPENDSLSTADHVLRGENEDDRAGWAVATVNRTGGDDVLVGAPGNASAGDAGAAYVVSDAEPGVDSLVNATATLTGEGEGDAAGWAVAEAGDFDGDGSQDVLVSAPGNNSTAADAGAAYLLTENVTGTVSLADARLKLAGETARDRAGWDADEAGDVNNDSYDDLVVGAPFAETADGESNAGIAYVVYGGEDDAGTVNLSDAGATLAGSGEDDFAGYSVSSAGSGDVTCDEYADVLVGAPGNNSTAVDAGAVYVVAGSEFPATERNLSDADATLAGEGEGDRAGTAVSDAMDVTGDGDEDVLVGAPFNNSTAVDAGAAYLLAGDCPEPDTPDDEGAGDDEPEDVVVIEDCVDEQGEVTVTNPNDEKVTFTIEGDSYTLAPSGQDGDSITLSDLDDGDYEWSAKTESGASVGGGTLTVDCDEPESEPEPEEVLVTLECIDEQGELTVTNPNDEKVTFTIEGDSYTLTANGTANDSITLSDLDDGDYQWNAKTESGDHVGGGTLTVDCDEPEPEPAPEDVLVTLECVDEQGELTVVNPNDQEVTFTIEGDSYTLAANGSDGDSLVLDDLDDGDYQWTAETMDGANVGGGTLTVDCDEPAPEPEPEDVLVTLECIDEQGELTVTNPNDVNVTFTIEGDSYTLTANGTANDSITLSDLDDGDYQWNAETEDGTNVGGGTLTVDCDPLSINASSPECGQLQLENPTDERVYVQFIYQNQPGNEGEFILDPGETMNVSGEGVSIQLTASTGSVSGADPGETVLINGQEQVTIDVEACDEEQPPAGSIVDVTCENVTLAANNVSQGALTFLVDFEDGTNTTVTVETDDGSFSGTVPFDNPQDKNISGVFLYAGNDTDTEPEGFLDDVDLDGLDCSPEQPPEYNPNGRIVDITCENVTIEVENITEGYVTIVVGYGDDTTENITVQTDNGSFSGTVPISNPDDKNISTVDLFAGEPGEGPPEQFMDDKDPFLDCSPTEQPEPEGLLVTQDCVDEQGEVTVTNPNDANVTLTFDGETYELAANGSEDDSVTIDDLDDGDYQWNATAEDGTDVGAGTLTVDCDEPRGTQDTVAVSENCEQLTVSNPADNDENVDFRIRNSSGDVVATVDDVAPGDSETIDGLSGDDYTVDARYVTDDSFGSDNVTVNGQTQDDVTVADCRQPTDTTVVSEDCEQITVTNPSDSAEPVDFRFRNASGGGFTVDDVEPGDSVTVSVSADDYTVDARYVTNDSFGSDNVTVDGQVETEISVEACEEPREKQDTVATSEECEQLTVRNPSENAENVDFRIRNSSGDVVATVDDVAPGDNETVEGVPAGEYTVDARFLQNDSFGSDNVTVNGEVRATVSVEACIVACPPDFGEFKVDSGNSDTQSGVEVTVSGDGSSATVKNTNDHPVSVWVKTGSRLGPIFREAATVDPGETVTVDGITVQYDDQPITHGISNVAITCPGVDRPSMPPYTQDSHTKVGDEPVDGTDANDPPAAEVTYSPSGPAVGEEVTFDASSSDDSDGTIVSYEWDFDGDGNTDARGETFSRRFKSTDEYQATLTVTDDSGDTDTATASVSVQAANDPPAAELTYSPSDPAVGEEVTFDASSSDDSDGTIVSYEWDFDGDGESDQKTAIPTVTRSFSGPGDKAVAVTVVDDSGASDSESTTVNVTAANQAPTADAGSDQTVDAEASVTLDATGSSDPDGDSLSYQWTEPSNVGITLSDPTSATPTFTAPDFDNEGALTFQVAVSDGNGGTDTDTVTVTVQPTSTDADGDGYPANQDCDDKAPEVNPDATETLDDVDNDCDGTVDEGLTDTDGDGTADRNDQDIDGDGVANDSDDCPEEVGSSGIDGCPSADTGDDSGSGNWADPVFSTVTTAALGATTASVAT